MYVPSHHRNVWPYPIEERGGTDHENYLLFSVSPTFPLLFWRAIAYDYYDSFMWRTTTVSNQVELPQDLDNTTKVLTVELSSTEKEIYLPTPSPTSIISNLTTSPNVKSKVFFDETSNIYDIRIIESASHVKLVYQATWDFPDIHKEAISLDDIPENIHKTYLQLPANLPTEVRRFADSLENSSLNVFDQITEDVKYIVNNFEYDYDLLMGRTQRIIDRDWVLTFLNLRKGTCIDAATALTIILRCQGIPARVCCGFKPTDILKDKVLYYTTSSHALTEVYLPPYGWIPFDATPAADLDSLPEDFPPLRPDDSQGHIIYLLRTLTSNILIRNEKNLIKGVITTNGRKSISSSVRISLDNREIAIVNTEANGSFYYLFYITPNEELGRRILTLDVDSKSLTLEQEVRIVARPSLTAKVLKKGFFGNSLNLKAYLSDDQGLPLEGQKITVENYGLSWETDGEGTLEFSIDLASKILPENIPLVISFNGSDQYLDATTSTQISTEPNPLIFLFILFGLSYVTFKENLPKKLLTSFRKKDKAKALEKSSLLFGEKIRSTKSSRLKICFPEIEDSLPAVWGVQDKLLIKCALEHDSVGIYNKLKVFVNKINVFEGEVNGNKCFTFSHVFEEKGCQKIMAILYDDGNRPLDTAEAELRIVNYREETIRLYQTFLQSLIQRDISIKTSMTAREIEYILQQERIASLNATCVTECFEEAEYSHHSILRRHYKGIYLAFEKVQLDVE